MFGLNLQMVGTIVRPVFALFKELLFGKYRIADYFRNKKIVLVALIAIGMLAMLYLNMVENALISVQHYRDTVHKHQVVVAKLKSQMEDVEEKRDELERRITFICISAQSPYCPRQDHATPDVPKPELDLGEF